MRLWVDECLSPTLVQRAAARGYEATCNRDRGLLGARDQNLHAIVIAEEAIFATNNEVDFVALCQGVELHTGLLILPQTDRRERQGPLLEAALDYIEQQAAARGESPADWMINKHVEVDVDGLVSHAPLP